MITEVRVPLSWTSSDGSGKAALHPAQIVQERIASSTLRRDSGCVGGIDLQDVDAAERSPIRRPERTLAVERLETSRRQAGGQKDHASGQSAEATHGLRPATFRIPMRDN